MKHRSIILKICSILMSSFITITMICNVYSDIKTKKSNNTAPNIAVSKSDTKTDWSDILVAMSGIEKTFEEENDSEDKPDHDPHYFFRLSTFTFFFESKLHSYIACITHLFANIKANHCSGLYIFHKAIII